MKYSCRMCNSSNLKQFLDLGYTPPADAFLRKEQLLEPEVYYPLRVVVCEDCGLIQLDYVVSAEILYRHDYPYESSMTLTGKKHWEEFANTVVEKFSLDEKDLVIDIGSNVGVLLGYFRDAGTNILGVDPASNIVRIAEKSGIETINEFFNIDTAKDIKKTKGEARVITGTNVFAHMDDLQGVVESVKYLLSEDGVFIIEAPYLTHLLDRIEYDTIYHEHLSYVSIKPVSNFLNNYDMEIIDIQERDIHGGSVRIFSALRGAHKINNRVIQRFVDEEDKKSIYSYENLRAFSDKVEKNRMELTWLLRKLKNEGKTIAGVSAPAKGMTLLNYCRIGTEILDFVTEKSMLKVGRYTPGTHIPVLTDKDLIDKMPDYALLLAWNFADEIMANLTEYTNKGGKFIMPIPVPRIIE